MALFYGLLHFLIPAAPDPWPHRDPSIPSLAPPFCTPTPEAAALLLALPSLPTPPGSPKGPPLLTKPTYPSRRSQGFSPC